MLFGGTRCGIKAGSQAGHLSWHESPDRRRAAARPRYSLITPPSEQHGGRTIFNGATGEEISYDEWKRHQMAAWAARESDPDVIDWIGVAETIGLAKARIEGIVGDYLSVWAGANGNSDDFASWMPLLIRIVEYEVAVVWQATEWHAAWFERACRKKVADALAPVAKEWQSRASRLEMQHLENPHLSISSLLAADGNLNFAFTLEQGKRTIESAEEFLHAWRTQEESTKSGNGGACAEPSSGAANNALKRRLRRSTHLRTLDGRQPLGDNPFPKRIRVISSMTRRIGTPKRSWPISIGTVPAFPGVYQGSGRGVAASFDIQVSALRCDCEQGAQDC